MRSPGLLFDGDLGDLGDLCAVVRGDLGVVGSALTVGIESSIARIRREYCPAEGIGYRDGYRHLWAGIDLPERSYVERV